MPIKPIMFLTVNILKKLPRINVYALDQVQLGIIPKNDMKFNFTVQMFERRTGKGDFKILQQIWLRICFSMKHDLKTTIVNVFTGK